MYNAYGSNVYKKYQVNMGNPYQIKPKKTSQANRAIVSAQKISEQDDAEAMLEKVRLEAEKIIQKANDEANEMLVDAQEKIVAYMHEIEQQAKEEGYKNGEALVRQHYQSLIDEAEGLKLQAREVLESTVSSLEEEIVDTVLEIGKKVISMELSQNRDVILGLIRTALLGSSLSEEAVVHVCSEDYDYVEENKSKILLDSKNNRNVRIYKDNGMEKGECFVETGYGSVDSSIETQFDGVERSFRELLGNEISSEQAAAAIE